jgi:molybdopterin-binding protein
MSQFVATITDIRGVESLKVVEFDFCGATLKMVSLELDRDIEIGKEALLAIKPTHITIAKESISSSNQLKATIISYQNGELLSSIKLQIGKSILESIVLLESLGFEVGDEVIAMMNPTDISILKIL